MKPVLNFLFLVLISQGLSSCALFQRHSLTNVEAAKEQVCLNSEGRGRFVFEGSKHVFSYVSHFLEEEASWQVAIDFPLYGRESIELEWNSALDRVDYRASYEQALLKNSQNLNPALVEGATSMWLAFFEDMLRSRNIIGDAGARKQISWEIDRKSLLGSLTANGFPAEIHFLNPVSSGYFGRFDFKLLSPTGEQEFGMELIVRNCLEKGDQ